MIRRPPRSTQSRSSAASDVYKRQDSGDRLSGRKPYKGIGRNKRNFLSDDCRDIVARTVSYTHLRAHETVLDLVCRLLLEKKNLKIIDHKTGEPVDDGEEGALVFTYLHLEAV